MSAPDQKIKIKDYQIHSPPLGEGTFGTVYRATYRSLSDRALKVFRPGAVDIVTMARELEKLSKVAEHNGIVTLHDFDLLNDPPYYAMGLHADQLPDGNWETRTLERLCGHVDYKEGWRLIREIADAVSYLHRNHIVHCDLKPSNILLTDENPHRIKICDFGQSRGMAAASIEPVGTPLYASPEQLRSPSDSSDGKGFRWDVYSFGVVAYKLLTGQLPRLKELAEAEMVSADPDATIKEATLEATLNESGNRLDGENLANMIEAVEEIEWPENCYVPSSRKLLIEECLSLDPNNRPADMREVRRRIIDRDHMRAARRARRISVVFGLLLVAAIWAGVTAFMQGQRAKEASEEAVISGRQAEQLALIIVNELNKGDFSGEDADELYSIIADHSETFLDNLPKNRHSKTTLRFSAQTASMRGRQSLERGQLDEALNKYQNSYDIRSKLGGKELERLAARDLMQIAKIYELKGDYEKAEESLLRVREWRLEDFADSDIHSTRGIQEIAEVYTALGDLYRTAGEPKEAIATYQDIARILSEATNEASVSQRDNLKRSLLPVLFRLGELQYQNGDLENAYDSFVKLATATENADSDSPTYREVIRNHYLDSIHFIGQILLDKEDKENALLRFREEIKMRQRKARMRPYDPVLKIKLAAAYQKAAECVDIADLTARNLGKFYMEQALALIASLPPDMRNDQENRARAAQYQSLLDSMLQQDE